MVLKELCLQIDSRYIFPIFVYVLVFTFIVRNLSVVGDRKINLLQSGGWRVSVPVTENLSLRPGSGPG